MADKNLHYIYPKCAYTYLPDEMTCWMCRKRNKFPHPFCCSNECGKHNYCKKCDKRNSKNK